VPEVVELLERDFGHAPEGTWAFTNHFLLDALDRGEHSRFVVWPEHDPVAVLYQGATGTLVPAGDPAAAVPLADTAEHSGWRILIGDLPLAQGILDHTSRALFVRRRVSAREQRFMTATADSVPADAPPDGFRLAVSDDIDRLTDFACDLHVEDRMGPPISRSGRSAVRSRMLESVAQNATWVVERGGQPVAKVDLSLRSRRRGAQIAGVFVDRPWRSRGIGGAAVRALARSLLDDGLPVVSLHVRSDNTPAMAAYRRAGFTDDRPWLLALR
jgi:ribosomal protein S18 acetylase RimI-like enzyme